MPELFAAVAPVAGGIQVGFLPKDSVHVARDGSSKRSVPVLDIHGRNDTTMPYNATLPPLNSSFSNGSVSISTLSWLLLRLLLVCIYICSAQ